MLLFACDRNFLGCASEIKYYYVVNKWPQIINPNALAGKCIFLQLVGRGSVPPLCGEARFRHFAATSLMMTNQIGVARTILANFPLTRHSQDRGRRPLLFVCFC